MSNRAKDLDREYFDQHPLALSYCRAPLPGEWVEVDVPAEARVSVYKINPYCRVRALESRSGQRIAEPIIDTDYQDRMDGRRKAA